MKLMQLKQVMAVVEVICDVFGSSTCTADAAPQYGELRASWGYGAEHDGQRYELHLCEGCFFQALAMLKRQRNSQAWNGDAPGDASEEGFGLVATEDYFGDGGRSVDATLPEPPQAK